MLARQFLEADVLADLDAEAELHAHALEDLAAVLDDVLLELEGWDAEGQQSADLRVLVVDDGLDAVARQHVGGTQAGRSGTDDRHPLAGLDHVGQVRAPALLEGLVGDVLLDRADGHRAEAVVERAGAFAEPVLRTDAAADLGQRIGLVAEFGGLEQVALGHQLEPVRDVVVNRALPLAVRVAAVQAASGLLGRLFGGVVPVDLAEVLQPYHGLGLGRILSGDVEKLEVILAHVRSPAMPLP